jgi:hypothetical protein
VVPALFALLALAIGLWRRRRREFSSTGENRR